MIVLRIVVQLLFFIPNEEVIDRIDYVMLAAMLCVGLSQAWMVIEATIKTHYRFDQEESAS